MHRLLAFATIMSTARIAAAGAPAASPDLLDRIADGQVAVASLVDPAHGVWVLDGGATQHVCGAALLELAVEVEVHARTYRDDADCTNRAHTARCALVPDSNTGGARFELRFDRTAAGLVLRALVRSSSAAGTPPTPHAVACSTATPVPTPPAPIVAATRRDEPSADGNPTVATQAMVRHLARGEWALADLVDRERGVASIAGRSSAVDDPTLPKVTRLCGDAIDRALPALRKDLTFLVGLEARGDATLSCENRRGDAECKLAQIGEWGAILRMHFRQTDRGLVLDAYGTFDENGVLRAVVEGDDLLIAQALARAWAQPCP